MRRLRAKFTIRRLMILVAVAGVLLGGIVACRRLIETHPEILGFIKNDPNQPKPELVASGVVVAVPSWLPGILGAAAAVAIVVGRRLIARAARDRSVTNEIS